jgi:hypothetical protein
MGFVLAPRIVGLQPRRLRLLEGPEALVQWVFRIEMGWRSKSKSNSNSDSAKTRPRSNKDKPKYISALVCIPNSDSDWRVRRQFDLTQVCESSKSSWVQVEQIWLALKRKFYELT